MPFFRITLLRSAIGLPRKTTGILHSLGLKKRLRTVYHPVSPSVAGQLFAVKELVDVQEVDQALSSQELKALRKPETGFYVEKKAEKRAEDFEIEGWTPKADLSKKQPRKAMKIQEGDEWEPTWTPADAAASSNSQPEAKN